jgi:hypothetical protein
MLYLYCSLTHLSISLGSPEKYGTNILLVRKY